jgi:hypothetical protein
MKLSNDTAAFLETLLSVSDSPDPEKRPFENSTIYDFHPEFAAAVDSFVSRFREYLAANHPDMDPDHGNRSFGGNVFFSLSGHGCGFWDERDGEWGDAMHSALVAFSASLPGHNPVCGRFEFMDLAKHRGGKIDLSYLVKYLPERRREMFGIHPPLGLTYSKAKPPVSKFHDKHGRLTPYSFGCGYVETYRNSTGDSLTLCREPNDWHVKGFICGKHVWEIFEKLSEARAFCLSA